MHICFYFDSGSHAVTEISSARLHFLGEPTFPSKVCVSPFDSILYFLAQATDSMPAYCLLYPRCSDLAYGHWVLIASMSLVSPMARSFF